MASNLIIAENSALTTNPYAIPFNPIQPRGLNSNQPSALFPTISGPGVIESPKDWYPPITFTWPALVRSITAHAALVAAFEDRQYAKTGINYFIGIADTDTKDQGYPFPGSNKYIEIRILEVKSAVNPIDNNLNQVIFDMVVTAQWMDAS